MTKWRRTESLKVAVSQRFFWDSSFVDFAERNGFFNEEGITVAWSLAPCEGHPIKSLKDPRAIDSLPRTTS